MAVYYLMESYLRKETKEMSYHCANCREALKEESLKKIAIGSGRNVVFCANCNCYVTIEETKKAVTPVEQPKQ